MKVPRFLRDVMVKQVITAAPDTSIPEIAKKMSRKRAGSAVITRRGRVVGIVTETDLIRLAAAGKDMKGVRAKDCMTRPVVTCREDARVLDALLLMRKKGIRHLPVLNAAGQLRGIVSIRDLIAVTQLIALRLV